ncbi:galactose-1-phosphate uridylyltransferase [Oceanotoga sp. DSM 15011]|uniref:Galactose-1-phosphate uridylyltransferase n=1 Tax=Oceanotoga teriensis TaxID=515440 RepID=A0AA45C4P7_9BACT|nr:MULTISPECIES: galactose-1-phosphate uridylyltransferase [Oceanotoga]MDN5343542.1 UDPglucose--hexose-phosphate uridylyltransferase [Oceanotoga sp.]MDO7977855.1 galactose-1-phosphate uridylyltransferase [Oceanotoga teriensis]PWJ86816.1 UDPglucose--hexose-1-phosphate uridylyltransferase [Oceanotoga teriensis]UYO99662.1 galactose-1-phosphate uridylyltransferase [Oceanotoga sp. DSM 15011]
MSELRKDPLTNRWVIISEDRAKRPMNYVEEERIEELYCPFDYGNENSTPNELLSFRSPDSKANESGWWVRVVPNKFSALKENIILDKSPYGIYDRVSGFGYHEVIIETPEHNTNVSHFSLKQMEEVFWAYLKRFNSLKEDKRIKYIQIFKNYGKKAGASLVHPHSQLIATSIVPVNLIDEIEGAKKYFNFKNRCVFCDIVKYEEEVNERIIFKSENFIVFEPYASRFPYETWIMPRFHSHDFGELEKNEDIVKELAEVSKNFYSRFFKVLNNPPYNMLIHTAPFGEDCSKEYHWHIEIIPRITNIAGFEWGTGFYINSVSPEKAADELKKEEPFL